MPLTNGPGSVPLIAGDADRLLGAVADALNTCERAGVIVDLEHGAAMTRLGYVVPTGDGRLGSRWGIRKRMWPAVPPDSSDEDQQ